MTLVGDTSQTSSPAGVDDWTAALEPFVDTRFRLHELTVNYRTPQEVADYAAGVLAKIDPDATAPTAIRSTGMPVEVLPSGAEVVEKHDGLSAVIDADNVGEMKGLEFDHVTVVNPGKIVEASPQGWQDLYVAVTRATQTLTVIGD